MITFNRFEYSKELFEQYKGSLDLDEDAIVLIDSGTDKYIYAKGSYFGSTEIYKGNIEPTDESIKLWIDTNSTPTLKYRNSTEEWETVATGGEISSAPEIYIGDKQPESSDVVVWYDTSGTDEPDEPTITTVTWEDIEDKPEFAKIATTGDYNDLINVPDFDLIKDSCTVYAYTYEESSYAPFTDEQRESNANAFIKIRQALSDKKDINITVIVVYESRENIEYRDCYITGTTHTPIGSGGSVSSILTSVSIESATIIQDINKPYLSHVKIPRFGNDAEFPDSAGRLEATVTNTYLVTDKDLDKHTTTYIGADTPTNSKYNLWVDTTNEEVVFKYKDENNAWQILSTGGSDSIIVDTELNETSENPIANKVVYNMAIIIEQAMASMGAEVNEKAKSENGLVEGRGFKVPNTESKYYLPNTTISSDPTVDDNHIIATKADTLSNEVIDNKATVYNLYAMDELSEERLEANAKALESVQNREVAIYKVYTNDDTYAIADVKLVPGPYLEAYVYVNTPNTTDRQATVTKYTYTFDQAGDYTTSDKEEVVLPSLSKVEEMVSQSGGGTGGGLELRELKMSGNADDNAYNLETLELIEQRKAISFVNLSEYEVFYPIIYVGDRTFFGQINDGDEILNVAFSIDGQGAVSSPKVSVNAPLFLTNKEVVKKWIQKNAVAAALRQYEPAYIIYDSQACLADYYQVSGDLSIRKFQFNYGSQRFERTYNAITGEEIDTTEIHIGGGVTEQKVEEMIAASVGDIKTLIVAINGEEV